MEPGVFHILRIYIEKMASKHSKVGDQKGARAREILAAISDAVISIDMDGCVAGLNESASTLLELSPTDCLGQLVSKIFIPLHLDARQPVDWNLDRVITQRLTVGHDEPVVLKTSNGNERFVTFRAIPCPESDQGLLVLSDVTDRVRLEHMVIKSQRHESVSMMAGGVAHDFNNILTGVLGNLSLVSAMENDPRIRQTVLSAEKAAERARGLAKQFLSLCRRGIGQCAQKAFNVRELLEEACTLITCGTQCRYDISVATDSEVMHADEDQMSQVFNNLIINAVQAMKGAGAIEIRVSSIECKPAEAEGLCIDPGRYFCIDFEDDGPGISATDTARIFDPYYTTKSGGHGLGLASCRSIMHLHGGALTVSSHLGKGSCFSCIIPWSDHSSDSVSEQQKNPDNLHAGMGRILVMDDEAMIRQIAGDMLELLGYTAGLSEHGEAMLEEYQRARNSGEPYDAVILDLTIPGKMGGKEAMVRLLEIDPDAVGVVSSGYSHDPIMEDPKKFGFTVAMQKPYTVQEFSSLLESLKDK